MFDQSDLRKSLSGSQVSSALQGSHGGRSGLVTLCLQSQLGWLTPCYQSPLMKVWDAGHGMALSTFRMCLRTSVKLTYKSHYRLYTDMIIVILNPIKLTRGKKYQRLAFMGHFLCIKWYVMHSTQLYYWLSNWRNYHSKKKKKQSFHSRNNWMEGFRLKSITFIYHFLFKNRHLPKGY